MFDNIRAVFIDLDGTLLDTIADLAAAANRVRADFGLAALSEARLAGFVGKGADVLVHRAMTDSPDGQLDNPRFTAARAAFDTHYTTENGRWARPYPGVMAGLERMRAAGLTLACITNKPQSFTEPLLQAQALAGYFELTLGGDALPAKKPDPLPLTHAAAHFGLPASQCVMIGDSVNDAQAARAAGMPVLLVPYGYNGGRDVRTIDSDGIVGTLNEAADLIIRS